MFLDVCVCVRIGEGQGRGGGNATPVDVIGLGSSEALSYVNRCVRCWHFLFPSLLHPSLGRCSDGLINQGRFTRHLFYPYPLLLLSAAPSHTTGRFVRDEGGGAANGDRVVFCLFF